MSTAKILELTFKVLSATLLIMANYGHMIGQEVSTVKLLEFKYGFHVPLADMKDRFGSNNDIGISFASVSLSNKIFFGADGIFIFGSTVKEDVIADLRSFDGSIVGINGQPGDVNLKERGYYIGINAGKIFPTGSNNVTITGIRAQIGAGLMQHKIRVQDNSNNIAALNKEYLPGYDRLTNGPAIHMALGYQYQSPKNNFHFHIMGDLYCARTQSRRDFDAATGGYMDQKRTDILAGVSIAYIVSISRSSRPDTIYY